MRGYLGGEIRSPPSSAAADFAFHLNETHDLLVEIVKKPQNYQAQHYLQGAPLNCQNPSSPSIDEILKTIFKVSGVEYILHLKELIVVLRVGGSGRRLWGSIWEDLIVSRSGIRHVDYASLKGVRASRLEGQRV